MQGAASARRPVKLDLDSFFAAELAAHAAALDATRTTLCEDFGRLVEVCACAVEQNGKILLFGNGGSAADAQHIATELTVRYARDRVPISAVALTADSSVLTAAGNDLGFEQIFARQIESLGRPGDVALGISTSGRSANVIAGLGKAVDCGLVAAALGGKGGGFFVGLADPLLVVPSDSTARIQEMHILLGHMLCSALEHRLGLS